jgi:hypothetical protein
MKLLDDLDAIYTQVKDFTIGYLIGYGIAAIICIVFLVAMLLGWSPIPKSISDAPRSGIPRGWDGVTITTDSKKTP